MYKHIIIILIFVLFNAGFAYSTRCLDIFDDDHPVLSKELENYSIDDLRWILGDIPRGRDAYRFIALLGQDVPNYVKAGIWEKCEIIFQDFAPAPWKSFKKTAHNGHSIYYFSPNGSTILFHQDGHVYFGVVREITKASTTIDSIFHKLTKVVPVDFRYLHSKDNRDFIYELSDHEKQYLLDAQVVLYSPERPFLGRKQVQALLSVIEVKNYKDIRNILRKAMFSPSEIQELIKSVLK